VDLSLDHGAVAVGTEDLLIEDRPELALQLHRGAHLEGVAEASALLVGHVGPVDHEAEPVLAVQPDQLLDTEQVLPGTLEVLQVIGVVHDAGVIGVLVVDLDLVHKGRHGTPRSRRT